MKVLIVCLWILLQGVAVAQPSLLEMFRRGLLQSDPLPKPDARGNFIRNEVNNHHFWMVVAPHGLNGRAIPPGHANFSQAPVVRLFPAGSLLTATPAKDTQTGFLVRQDSQDNPWLRVLSCDPGQTSYCYVRAHKDMIAPVKLLSGPTGK